MFQWIAHNDLNVARLTSPLVARFDSRSRSICSNLFSTRLLPLMTHDHGRIDVTIVEADMQRYIRLKGLDDSVRKRPQ
jgi:hypothetical protein